MTADAIRDVLQRYGVYTHYLGSKEAGVTRYAVFRKGRPSVQETGPTTHGEAHIAMREIIIRDIMLLSQGRR